MYKMYYLFSDIEYVESIYVCENADYIDKPILKTDVHPLGVILIMVMKILKSYKKHISNYDFDQKCLLDAFKINDIENSSFVSGAKKDISLYRVLELLLLTEKQVGMETNREYKVIKKSLDNYMKFFELCQNAEKYATYRNLIDFAKSNNDELLNYSFYTTEEFYNTDELLKRWKFNSENSSEVHNDGPKIFDPSLKKKSKPLFKLTEVYPKNKYTPKLLKPFYVFEIKDIIDLVLASLQCIFKHHFIFGNCQYCNELFVTHNKARKYCPPINREQKSCYDKVKLEKQLEAERSIESRKTYKNIAEKLRQRIRSVAEPNEIEAKIREKEYNDFIILARECRKNDTITEEEYIDKMQEYYQNVRASSKERKNKKKQ